MADCCEDKACAIDALRVRQSTTLKIVLGINAVMFVVELVAGLIAGSTALLADCLDNLGDALTYALSLYAVSRSLRTKAKVAIFKGALILLAGIFVLLQVSYHLFVPVVPLFKIMGIISFVALLANGTCLLLLWKHKEEDVNMSSVWYCSRNDIASNIAVFIAAGAVWLTNAGWPDIVIGLGLAILFLMSAIKVLKAAVIELKKPDIATTSIQIIKCKKD